MTVRPSRPPEIRGFSYESDIRNGVGGFATVYRYRQLSLDRFVAVKVLDAHLDADGRRRFEAEAQAMVRTVHPHVVGIIDSGTTDDGRGFLVMTYHPQNLAERIQHRGLGTREVLRIGIRVASGVHAVHERGLLHRDIKPANILMDDNDLPLLADFGIAGRIADDSDVGMSIPWSPPEVLDGAPNTVRSDVYSLAATVWHLLVGRALYEQPGGDNSRPAMEQRTRRGPVPRTGVPEVPAELEEVLAQALSPDPERRPATAHAFAKELQRIQLLLGHERTEGVWRDEQLELPAQAQAQSPVDTVHRTIMRGPTPLDRTVDRAPKPNPPEGPQKTVSRQDLVGHTQLRAPTPPPPVEAPRRPVRKLPIVLTGVGVAAVAVVLAVVLTTGDDPAPHTPVPAVVGHDAGGAGAELPPGRPTVTATRIGKTTVRFAWTYSATLANDTFSWRTNDKSGVAQKPSIDLTVPAGKKVCVQVKVVRADGGNGSPDWSEPGCSG